MGADVMLVLPSQVYVAGNSCRESSHPNVAAGTQLHLVTLEHDGYQAETEAVAGEP